MKKLFAFTCFVAAGLIARAEELDLGSRGKLSLYLDNTWKFAVTNEGERVLVVITPKSGDVNAACKLAVTFPEVDRLDTKARLKQRVEVLGTPLEAQSVERKAIAQEIAVRTGFGLYCNFTDPALVGKPPEKDNFKTMSLGIIRVKEDVLLQFEISADGFRSAPYQTLLGMLEGMEYAAANNRKSGSR